MASSADSSPSDGITGGYTGTDLGLEIAMATFTGIAWYNAIELLVLIFVTFQRYHGLYFWSLLVSSAVGVIPYSMGFLMKFFQLTSATWLSVTFLTIGWYAMVTGQSMVLYSRLHLLNQNTKILRPVLSMIIVNAILLHIPTTVLTYGSNFDSYNQHFIAGYNVMEKIQMTGFCLQEFILSGIYIYEAVGLLKANPEHGSRKIMYQLLCINLLIITMDIGLLVVEYLNLYTVETTLKGAVYSIKLKLEFAVLGKLVHIVRTHSWKPETIIQGHATDVFPDFVDATRVTSDVTHATSHPQSSHNNAPFYNHDDVSIAMFEHSAPSPEVGRPRPSITSESWSGETRTNRVDATAGLGVVDFGDMSLHPDGHNYHPG
ncbi:integral membrane protein [Talaromyces proteolyticus]|uniref:Integral membrane protein n=1 Tax=Talaromyces proteolyticus TaxID=1131652 RepID=A0AAD4PT74_9EURO|nr:uncharacterized protein BGW36DRAFT_362341 [Talaromyces proteolyticus]KAH8692790.1 integral membrane protein [Talaromyces proteolyticus]